MISGFRLHTGPDGDSHVQKVEIASDALLRSATVQFRETSAHASRELHTAPTAQYVLTLTGTVEFTLRGGETFSVSPGDVLLVEDTTGSGHGWRVTGHDPWTRACVIFANGAIPECRILEP